MQVKKEKFEDRLARRMKNWKQEQHEKKVFGDPETEDVVWQIVTLPDGGFIRKPFKKIGLEGLPLKDLEDKDMDYSGAFESDVEEYDPDPENLESESERMQAELEPIGTNWNRQAEKDFFKNEKGEIKYEHPTEHDESDEIEANKRADDA